ncbi:MAG: DODA-type extradiol aromatic ring-opening family dioxygenase [Candidatus Geothermincolia bacterium]
MDYLKLCCVTPHPPILVPEIGGREVARIENSARAMEVLADEIESINPETLVIMSPHSPVYADAFAIKVAPALGGSFSQFGAPQVRVDTRPDRELALAVVDRARSHGLPCEPVGADIHRSGASDLDHGILVPLYFLARRDYPLVCLSMSMLDFRAHYVLGVAIREAVEAVGRRAVFVASGDMSHRLIPGAPAGYSPRGEEFDKAMVKIVSSGDFSGLFDLDARLIDDAGECGLRSVFTLAGAVDGYTRQSSVLSYEGPFGVGYLVARVVPGKPDQALSLMRSKEG